MAKHGLDIDEDGNPIYWYDARKGQPKRRRTGEDGRVVTEKLPQGPYRRMVNPRGDVILFMPAASAAAAPDGPYGARRFKAKLREGFLPADECPLAMHRMPLHLRQPGDEPCPEFFDKEGNPRRVPKAEPCVHLQRIIAARKVQRAEEAAQFEAAFKSQVEQMAKAQGDVLSSLAETQKELVSALKELRSGGGDNERSNRREGRGGVQGAGTAPRER